MRSRNRLARGAVFLAAVVLGPAAALLGLATTWGNSPDYLPVGLLLSGVGLFFSGIVGLIVTVVNEEPTGVFVACLALAAASALLTVRVFV